MKKLLTTPITINTKPKRVAARLVFIGGLLMSVAILGGTAPLPFALGILGSVLFIVGLVGLLVLTLAGIWSRK
ncbi:MAG: hypothetical protein Q7S60_01880 [bacterium]|nr:hypothetical protein [bacterium]